MPGAVRVVDRIIDQADFDLLGSLAVGDVIRYSGAKWRNFAGAGATLPTTPVIGQVFVHTPTGRSNLMVYDGSVWRPIFSIGAWTLFVDTTNGTDNQNLGWGTGANAFKTVQFAADQIAGQYSGNILANVAAGTYAETVNVRGKFPTGAFTITIRGALSVVESVTATGGTIGSGASHGTVTKSTNWGAYTNLWLQGKSGSNNNVYRIIDGVSGTTATIVGYWSAAPASGDPFDVVEPGTTVNQINVGDQQQNVVIENVAFNYPNGAFTNIVGALGSVLWRRCRMVLSGTDGTNLQTGGLSVVTLEEVHSNRVRWFIMNQSAITIRACRFVRSQASTGRTLQIGVGATANLVTRPSVLDGDGAGGFGITALSGGNVSCNSLFCIIKNYSSSGTGARAESTGTITEAANVQYSGNTTNTSADSATYGVIS